VFLFVLVVHEKLWQKEESYQRGAQLSELIDDSRVKNRGISRDKLGPAGEILQLRNDPAG
jgi:hypothetical protein